MPTIIDSLVVTLGLDPSKFNQGEREADKRLERGKKTAVQRGDQLEKSAKKQQAAFGLLKGEVLGLFTVVGGLATAWGFTDKLTQGDAAIGRLSRTIGVSTEEIGAWQGVLRGAGGTSEDAAKDLSTLASAAQEIALTGQSRLIPFLNLLHVSLSDLNDPTETLLKISDAFSKMDPRQAAEIGREMGFSPAMISTLQKGRGAVTALVAEQRKLAPVTKANADAAEQLQRNLADAKSEAGGMGRTIVNRVLPALTDGLKWFKALGQEESAKDTLYAVGDAFVGLGKIAQGAFDLIGGLLRGIVRLLSGDFTGAWQTAKATVENVARDIGGALGYLIDMALKFWDALSGKNHDKTAASRTAQDMIRYGQGRAPAHDAPRDSQGRAQTPPVTPTAAKPLPEPAHRQERFERVVANFTARGYSLPAARGMAAGIGAESRFDETAFNPAGGGQGAYGLGQWRGPRLRALIKRFGAHPTFDQQLEFMASELATNERGRGVALQGAGNAEQALKLYVNDFMRPGAAGAAGDIVRGQHILSETGGKTAPGAQTTSVTIGRIDVHTQATDARGIARDLVPALASAVPQANLGTQ